MDSQVLETEPKNPGRLAGVPRDDGNERHGENLFVCLFVFHNKKHHDQPVNAFLAWPLGSPASGNSMEGKGRGPFLDLRSCKMESTLCLWIDSLFFFFLISWTLLDIVNKAFFLN